jgi:hypothetical protein
VRTSGLFVPLSLNGAAYAALAAWRSCAGALRGPRARFLDDIARREYDWYL